VNLKNNENDNETNNFIALVSLLSNRAIVLNLFATFNVGHNYVQRYKHTHRSALVLYTT